MRNADPTSQDWRSQTPQHPDAWPTAPRPSRPRPPPRARAPLSLLHSREIHQPVIGRQERDRHRRGLRKGPPVGHPHDQTMIGHRHRSQAIQQPHHAITNCEVLDPGPNSKTTPAPSPPMVASPDTYRARPSHRGNSTLPRAPPTRTSPPQAAPPRSGKAQAKDPRGPPATRTQTPLADTGRRHQPPPAPTRSSAERHLALPDRQLRLTSCKRPTQHTQRSPGSIHSTSTNRPGSSDCALRTSPTPQTDDKPKSPSPPRTATASLVNNDKPRSSKPLIGQPRLHQESTH